jgi:hypothetical protein
MSALEALALTLVAAWIGVLSVVIALLVRQVALLTKQVDPRHSLDGLTVGRRIPRPLADLLPDSSGSVLVLGSGCAPCLELVNDLRDVDIEHPVVAVIEGEPALAAVLAEKLPSGMRRVTGEEADRAYAALDLQTTPFIFSVDRRQIVFKTPLKGAEDFLSLLRGSEVEPQNRSRVQTREIQIVR